MDELTTLLKSCGFEGEKLDEQIKVIGQTVQLKILAAISKTLPNQEQEELAKLFQDQNLIKERLEFLQTKIKENDLIPPIEKELRDYFSGLVEVFSQKASTVEKKQLVELLAPANPR